jgi:drug/metabolite transporter (DMT)-like permease
VPTPAENLRAAGLLAIAAGADPAQDALSKALTGQGIPIGMILGIRGLFTIGLYVLLFRILHQGWSVRQLLEPGNLIRACLEAALSWVTFHALSLLPLATVTGLFFTTPLITTALAAIFLGERVRIYRLGAVIVGFVGILLTLRPGAEGFTPALLLPLLSASLAAVRDLMTRRLRPGLPTSAVALATVMAMTTSGIASVPLLPWPALQWSMLAILFGAAALTATAFWFYIQSTRLGELSFLAPFRYVSIPLAGLFGFLFWGDVPTMLDLCGITLIVGSGIVIFHRERMLARRAAAIA